MTIETDKGIGAAVEALLAAVEEIRETGRSGLDETPSAPWQTA